MALRSPTQPHSYWGTFATADLPTTDPNLEVGDTAFDTTLGQLVACASIGPVVWEPVGNIELTGDVLAGPGDGPQAATVVGIQGQPVSAVAPSVDGQTLTWNGSEWVPGAPAGGSGGGGLVYYCNAGTNAQAPTTGLPGTPKELGTTAEAPQSTIMSGALPHLGTWDVVAGFVTNAGSPGSLSIPAGLWDFNVWASSSAPQPNTTLFRVKVYSYDGANPPTLIATGTSSPLFDPTQVVQYACSVLLPQTTILATDRIYVELEARATSAGHTITLYFGDNTPTHVHTTLSSISGTGVVHVLNGVVQSPAAPVNLAGGGTEITGTLPIGNGGTGLSATPTDGQLLIGDTATNAYVKTTLTAGANISVTNGAGSVTVAATGVVTSVGASAPITSSGGTAPTIGIDAATTLAAGSMSAADKTKLDSITAGAAVASVGASSPLASSGGTTPSISLSGAVPIANGGTGLTTTPTDGKLLIGKTSTNAYELATLTAGTGIAITNGGGSITVNARTPKYPAIDANTILAWNFTGTSGSIANLGAAGSGGDLVTIVNTPIRNIPGPVNAGTQFSTQSTGSNTPSIRTAQGTGANLGSASLTTAGTMVAFFDLSSLLAIPSSSGSCQLFVKAYRPTTSGWTSPFSSCGLALISSGAVIYGYIGGKEVQAPFTLAALGSSYRTGYHMWGITFEGGTAVRMYWDGREVGSTTSSVPATMAFANPDAAPNAGEGPWFFGANVALGNSPESWDHRMYHARVENVVRDATWMAQAWRDANGWP